MSTPRIKAGWFDKWVFNANSYSHWILLAPIILFLVAFIILPILQVVNFSLTDPEVGIENFITVLTTPFYLKTILNTLTIAAIVAVSCLLLGYPVAYVIARAGGSLGLCLLIVVTMSFWTSFLVRTYAWMVILGSKGPVVSALKMLGFSEPVVLFTNFSAILAMVHIMLPFMIMALYAVMSKIDGNLMRAAASLGARPLAAFLRVWLPLSLPGVVTGFSFVFIVCLGFYVTPVLLGSPRSQMIAGVIGDQIEYSLAWGEASAIAIVLLIVTLGLFYIYNKYAGLDRLGG